MHRILLDTNVLLDFLLERNHYYPESKKILDACDRGMFVGYMAAHSVPNMFYIMGRDHLIRKYRRELLTKLCTFIKVSDVGGQEIKAALADEQFIDFEDGLQYQCAQVTAVDLIITRNTNDFIASEIPVLTPSEFCKQYLTAKINHKY